MSENRSDIRYGVEEAKKAFIDAFGIKSDAYSGSHNGAYQTDGNRVFGKTKYQIISLEDAINALNEARCSECKITALTKPGKKLDVVALEKVEDAGICVEEIPYKYQSIRRGSYQVKATVNIGKFSSVWDEEIQEYLEYFTEPWDIEFETKEFCIKLEDMYCGKWAGLEIRSETIKEEPFDKLLKEICKLA
ncbi:MAG: hypothetical protein U9Q92_01570 [archaeon]|nr:hypothetical protein [archaeon]